MKQPLQPAVSPPTSKETAMTRLKAIVTHDRSNRPITTYVDTQPGEPGAMRSWMQPFMAEGQQMVRIYARPGPDNKFGQVVHQRFAD
jgi:hypothetical protein